ncbi:hypothetical protein L0Z72_01680, partial [candidate division KSB1 bacterium]|nr:hypothetical protein [candidate division KSB1 bacterium]
MSHQILKTRLVTAFCFMLLLIFHASIGAGIDKKFQSQQISNQSNKSKKVISSIELQQISDRLKAKLSLSQQKNAQTSLLRQAMQDKKPRMFSINKIDSSSEKSELKIYWNKNNSTPTFISVKQESGSLSKQGAPLSASAMAIEFFKANSSLFKLENPEAELQVTEETRDALGKTHVKFNQYYKGIPVWGHDIVTHLTEHNQIYA